MITLDEAVLNVYECESCSISWAEVWDCGCDTRCDSCNRTLGTKHSYGVDYVIETIEEL